MLSFRVLVALATLSLACAPVFGETTQTVDKGKEPGKAKEAAVAKHMFAKFDKNADGKLTKEEAAAALKARFAEMDANKDGKASPEEVAANWKAHRAAMDTNKDGVITVEEFMIFFTGKPPKEGLKKSDTMDGPDKDGIVTEDEYAAFYLMRFDKVDLNKDGKVTPDEMDGAVKAYFKEHNKDGDETLEEAEAP